MATQREAQLEDILKSIKSEVHVVIQSFTHIDRYGLFSTSTIKESFAERLPSDGWKKLGIAQGGKRSITDACNDLTKLNIFDRFEKRELKKKGFDVPVDGAFYMFAINPFVQSQFFYLCAMYALAFTHRTGISVYDILGKYDSKREKTHNLQDWLMLIVEINNRTVNEEVITLESLAAKSTIPAPTIYRRLKTWTEQGYVTKQKIGKHPRYKVNKGFVRAIKKSGSWILKDLYDKLMDPSKDDRDIMRSAMEYFTVPSLVSLLDDKYGMPAVQRIVTKLKSRNLVTEVETNELPDNIDKNDTLVCITDKGTPIFSEFGPILYRSHKERCEPRLVQEGVCYFTHDRRIDMRKYSDAVENAVKLYAKANPNVH